jgi:hypothetical protein
MRENVATDSKRGQRGKLLEGKFHCLINQISDRTHKIPVEAGGYCGIEKMKAASSRRTPNHFVQNLWKSALARRCAGIRASLYLEEVRDLPAEIRGALSSALFGFPSASTPLPV